MTFRDYKYPIEQCDIPEVRRASLSEYRTYRRKCLDYLIGDADTSVMNQVHNLAWYTAVFRTLNEARRLEPDRTVNGALWELTTAGYASLMALGIRKLIDRDPRTDSLWNMIAAIERRPELLTREKFVCYDGVPYDYEEVKQKHFKSLNLSGGVTLSWIPTKGPQAWGTSEMMHQAFDELAGMKGKRKRTDTVQSELLQALKDGLSHQAIDKVCTMANRLVAHAERVTESADQIPMATYKDIDEALKQIVKVATFLSSSFFFDASLGSVVPTPQFDVLEGLDAPWVTTANLQHLREYWYDISTSMSEWANSTQDEFLPPK